MSLEQQNAEESDFLEQPGFTADQIKPQGFFSGLTPETPIRGAASGVLETGSVLAKGIGAFLAPIASKGTINPLGIGLTPEENKPWETAVNEISSQISDDARAASKRMMPDPRTTGTAGNLVFGASKVLTEAGLMTAATGSPVAGAFGLGAVQGVSRYRDLREQGVDEDTARRGALIEGGAAAAGMLAPVGLPAGWIADMAPGARLLTQLATGAASNVGQGVAQRYASHKILADAGYSDLADQNRTLDGEAILADALAGAGFGGMHFLHQRPEFAEQARRLAENDGALRDAARVVQDSHEVTDRAPGVPVDAESAAVHREALEKAVGDLLRDEPVDVGDIADHGTFARQEEHTLDARQMFRDEFERAGVFDEGTKLDEMMRAMESRYEPTITPRVRETLNMPDEEGTPRNADDILAETKEQGEKAKEDEPLFKLAADCAGRVA